MKYGDYLKITNMDNKIHDVILFADRQSGSAVLATPISPDDSFSMPVYDLGTFRLTSWNENEKEYLWMHGVVTVKEH